MNDYQAPQSEAEALIRLANGEKFVFDGRNDVITFCTDERLNSPLRKGPYPLSSDNLYRCREWLPHTPLPEWVKNLGKEARLCYVSDVSAGAARVTRRPQWVIEHDPSKSLPFITDHTRCKFAVPVDSIVRAK